MLNSFKVKLVGEFDRNVLTLMTGTGLAQLIPIACTPLLSRIYTPEQFGVLALFNAIVSSISVLATGRYELAIMLPPRDADALNIAYLSMSINAFMSASTLAVIAIFHDAIENALEHDGVLLWLYFVPLAVLLNGTYLNLNYWSNRNKLYPLMANRRILQSGGTCAAQLGLGVSRSDAGGLVIGSIVGQGLAIGLMVASLRRRTPEFMRHFDWKRLWLMAKQYKSFPQLLAPAHTLAALTVQLPIIFVNAAFGLTTSGFFMLAERVVGIPLSLVSASVGDVFRQEMSQRYMNGMGCRAVFVATLKKLTILATPPFVGLMLIAPAFFAFVFGEKWRVAGEYAQIMCPMFFVRFISNPLSLTAIVAQKNMFEFLWQITLLAFLGLAAASYGYVALSVERYIAAFAGICILFDLINLVASYRFACAGDRQGVRNKT